MVQFRAKGLWLAVQAFGLWAGASARDSVQGSRFRVWGSCSMAPCTEMSHDNTCSSNGFRVKRSIKLCLRGSYDGTLGPTVKGDCRANPRKTAPYRHR